MWSLLKTTFCYTLIPYSNLYPKSAYILFKDAGFSYISIFLLSLTFSSFPWHVRGVRNVFQLFFADFRLLFSLIPRQYLYNPNELLALAAKVAREKKNCCAFRNVIAHFPPSMFFTRPGPRGQETQRRSRACARERWQDTSRFIGCRSQTYRL